MMRKILLIALLPLLATGCGIVYRQPIYQGNLIREDAVEQLKEGQTKQQVAALLGTPSIADPFHANRWDYTASERVRRVGKTETKNFTVFFEDNQVTRWEGDYFEQQNQQLIKDTRKQFGPNLPKDNRRGR